MSTLAYHLLKAFSHSRNRRTNDQIAATSEALGYNPAPARSFLKHVGKHVTYTDKTIMDIGCGTGDLAITLAKSGARHVVGIDLDEERVIAARHNAAREGVAACCEFHFADFVDDYQPTQPCDIVFNQSAFEHILSPLSCLHKIHACLAPGGTLATLFGPMWLSPYGAHMWGFTTLPWVHLLFPEPVVLRVRQECYRPDEDAHRYEEIRGHLNRMTLRQFHRYVTDAGFVIHAMQLNPAQVTGKYKWINRAINAIVPLQELGAHQVLAVLRKPI